MYILHLVKYPWDSMNRSFYPFLLIVILPFFRGGYWKLCVSGRSIQNVFIVKFLYSSFFRLATFFSRLVAVVNISWQLKALHIMFPIENIKAAVFTNTTITTTKPRYILNRLDKVGHMFSFLPFCVISNLKKSKGLKFFLATWLQSNFLTSRFY